MGAPPAVRVDVRDMVCAQALAVVAHAMEHLRAGEALEVLYNAADVRQDLLVWAGERARTVQETAPGILQMQRA